MKRGFAISIILAIGSVFGLITLVSANSSNTGIPVEPLSTVYTYSAVPALAIPDNLCPSVVTTTITVPDNYMIGDLNVGIWAAHENRGDLEIRITSPEGTMVLLVQDDGGANNLDVILDDSATIPNDIYNHPEPPTSYFSFWYPNTPLSAVNGEYSQGTWTLSICDDGPTQTGMIYEWALFFTSGLIINPPATSQQVCKGRDVEYDLTIYNTTAFTSSFELSYVGVWPYEGPGVTPVLTPGTTWDFQVTVHIPWAAIPGDFDILTVTASGAGDIATAALTTTALMVDGWRDYSNVLPSHSVAGSSVIYYDGRLYKIGGDHQGAQTWLDIYDIATDTWSQGADMPAPRSSINCEVITGKIYCAGGFYNGGRYSTLFIYDIATNAWTTGAPMPASRYMYASATIGGLYYVIGGYASSYLKTVYVYDPALNSWTVIASMTTTRIGHAAGAIGGKIFVAGGFNNVPLSSVEIYDPVLNSWTGGPEMPSEWMNAADGVIDDRYLILAGGADWNAGLSTESLILDAVDNTWEWLPNINHAVASAEGDGNGIDFWVVSGKSGAGSSYSPYTTRMILCDTTCIPISGLDFTWDPFEPWATYSSTFAAMAAAGSPTFEYDWYFGDGAVGSGQTIDHTFDPAMTYTVILTATNCEGASTASAAHEVVVIDPPTIAVDPVDLYSKQLPNMTTTQQIEICNQGDYPLDWELSEAEAPPFFLPVKPASPAPQPDIIRLPDGTVDCSAYENYPLFEPAEVAVACPVAGHYSVEGTPYAPTDTGFALNMYPFPDIFVSFTLNDFPGQTSIGYMGSPVYGMDFDPSATILYALNDASDQLGMIDLATGTFIGLVPCVPPIDNWTGLTIDPVTGIFYASDATSLYIIDPATGNHTLVGPFGTNLMIAIAINMEGEMYGHDIDTDSIYSINLASGAATLIGPTGYLANFAQGMDFDNDDGMLYIFLYQGSGENVYGTVDLTTGTVNPLSVSSPHGDFEGAIQVPSRIHALPWLTETPIAGTVPGDSCINVDVTFDSTGLNLGSYLGILVISSNDPAVPLTVVPVELEVQAGVDFIYYDLEDVIVVGESVSLAGNFNGWDPRLLPMLPNGDYSEFTASIMIPTGDYQYAYVVYTDTIPSGPPHWNWLQSYPDGSNRYFAIADDSIALNDFRDIDPGYWILQGPPDASTYVGFPTENIYGQIGVDGFTNEGIAPRGLIAELGYGTEIDPALWTTWNTMTWNSQQGDNAQYFETFIPTAAGVYSYAVRYEGNWGLGNPNAGWLYGDLVWEVPPVYNSPDAGVLTVLDLYADLVITMSDDPDPVEIGETLVYTITVENLGDFDATVLEIVDTLPAGVIFVAASSGCVEVGGIVTCNLGELPAGTTTTLFIELLAPVTPGAITNQATVTSDIFDPDGSNNTVTQETEVSQTSFFTFFTFLPFAYK